MKYKEFLEYLEVNLNGYETFMRKATQFQNAINLKRPPKSRWDDGKVEKTVSGMWKTAMQSLYNTLKREIDSDSEYVWKAYIEKNNILESVSESISELDFTSTEA